MATATDNNHKIVSPVNVEKRQEIDIQTGDTVRVMTKISDGDGGHRLQPFEGVVLARKHGSEAGATFTVRREIDGVGVEKVFPLYSPQIDEINIIRRVKTRKSKLYHIRDKAARKVRRQMRKMVNVDISTREEEPVEENEEGSTDEESAADESDQATEEASADEAANEDEATQADESDTEHSEEKEKEA